MSLFLYTDLQPTSTTAATQHCIPGTTNIQSPSSSGESSCRMGTCSHHRQILSPCRLFFQPPLPQVGPQTMTNGPVVQPVAAGLPPNCSPLPAAPFQKPTMAVLSQPFPALAGPLTCVPSWSFCLLVLQALQPCRTRGGSWGKLLELMLMSPSDQHGCAALGQGQSAQHSCPLSHVTVGRVPHFCAVNLVKL